MKGGVNRAVADVDLGFFIPVQAGLERLTEASRPPVWGKLSAVGVA